MDDGPNFKGPGDFSGFVPALVVYQDHMIDHIRGDFRVGPSQGPFCVIGGHHHHNVFSFEH
jgi:hypothetical protein